MPSQSQAVYAAHQQSNRHPFLVPRDCDSTSRWTCIGRTQRRLAFHTSSSQRPPPLSWPPALLPSRTPDRVVTPAAEACTLAVALSHCPPSCWECKGRSAGRAWPIEVINAAACTGCCNPWRKLMLARNIGPIVSVKFARSPSSRSAPAGHLSFCGRHVPIPHVHARCWHSVRSMRQPKHQR